MSMKANHVQSNRRHSQMKSGADLAEETDGILEDSHDNDTSLPLWILLMSSDVRDDDDDDDDDDGGGDGDDYDDGDDVVNDMDHISDHEAVKVMA